MPAASQPTSGVRSMPFTNGQPPTKFLRRGPPRSKNVRAGRTQADPPLAKREGIFVNELLPCLLGPRSPSAEQGKYLPQSHASVRLRGAYHQGMPRVSTSPSSARWPFWLLLGAWLCANSPQAATYAFLSWAAEARSFSHQQRLTTDVAFVLAGENRPAESAVAATAPSAPFAPAIPADAVLKKLDLAVEGTIHVLTFPLRAPEPAPLRLELAGVGRSAPPHEPPRALLVS